MQKESLNPTEFTSEESPTVSKSNWFSGDVKLRSFGYTIHSRKKDRQPTWSRNGKVFTQVEAHAEVRKRLKGVVK